MSNNIKNLAKKVLIVGSGYMASEYAKVLSSLKVDYEIVGRGLKNCKKMKEKFSVEVFSGGIENFTTKKDLSKYSHIINTVNIHLLNETTQILIKGGAKKILLEKPGDLNISGLKKLSELSNNNDADILIAYNRRFYSSVVNLKKLVKNDGGILSVHFDFTEWIHKINPAKYDKKSLKKWIMCNSSHVIDTVFYLIGIPKSLNSYAFGEKKIEWHPNASAFLGFGVSEKNIPFTYHSNWQSSGRWSIKVLTKSGTYYLEPLEILKKQEIGSINIEKINLNYSYDENFKPGIYNQVNNFIRNNFDDFCTIKDQLNMTKYVFNKIANY
jgi:predicted dehydrogenase